MRSLTCLIVLAALVLAAPAVAQPPVPNPTGAEWTPSPDHQVIDDYQLGYFLAGATDPVTVVDVGKPIPDAQNVCRAGINVQPLAFGLYIAKIRARAGTLWSEWSDPSNDFSRVPGPPGGPVVKK